jgi:hypothetical protein
LPQNDLILILLVHHHGHSYVVKVFFDKKKT